VWNRFWLDSIENINISRWLEKCAGFREWFCDLVELCS